MIFFRPTINEIQTLFCHLTPSLCDEPAKLKKKIKVSFCYFGKSRCIQH